MQIDYGRIGMLFDPSALCRRTLYAFVVILGPSRMKYVEPTFQQDEKSFVCSHTRMFRFFGGVPERTLVL